MTLIGTPTAANGSWIFSKSSMAVRTSNSVLGQRICYQYPCEDFEHQTRQYAPRNDIRAKDRENQIKIRLLIHIEH